MASRHYSVTKCGVVLLYKCGSCYLHYSPICFPSIVARLIWDVRSAVVGNQQLAQFHVSVPRRVMEWRPTKLRPIRIKKTCCTPTFNSRSQNISYMNQGVLTKGMCIILASPETIPFLRKDSCPGCESRTDDTLLSRQTECSTH